MRTTIVLDDKLLADAQELTGIEDMSSLVYEALKGLVARESSRRLALLGGTMPDLELPPRRRFPGGMILPDTSVWIGYLRNAEPVLQGLLEAERVVMHPFVLGELALGGIRNRAQVFAMLSGLPTSLLAATSEVLSLLDAYDLAGSGVGYVDLHLLASARLDEDVQLWTRDRRLAAAAESLGVGFVLATTT